MEPMRDWQRWAATAVRVWPVEEKVSEPAAAELAEKDRGIAWLVSERIGSRKIRCIFCNFQADTLESLKDHSAECEGHPLMAKFRDCDRRLLGRIAQCATLIAAREDSERRESEQRAVALVKESTAKMIDGIAKEREQEILQLRERLAAAERENKNARELLDAIDRRYVGGTPIREEHSIVKELRDFLARTSDPAAVDERTVESC
jgi:hypothetical protein